MKYLLVVGWLVALARPADAQIVNIQGQLAAAPDEDKVTGQIEIKADWREGNVQLFDIGGTGSITVRRGRLLGLAIVRAEYGKALDTVFKRRSFEHVRMRYTLSETAEAAATCPWRWEAFGQHELDQFRRISVRAVVGTGPAYQIVKHKRAAFLTGIAYMFELEQFSDLESAPDAGQRFYQHRASFYVTGNVNFTESVSLVETVYLQPRIDELDDVRVLGELALTKKLSKRIALTDGFIVAYDRTPPDGIKRLDTQLRIALLVTF
jgi:hypothetical protein